MRSQPSIIIIGAGMAGLSAGCYAQMNGFETTIFEMNHRAGGVCQSWERSGYTINGCIHWLVGSSEQSSFHQIWKELGAVQDLTFINHDRFGHFEHQDGTVILYADVDRLEQHLLRIAPEDEKWIRALTQGIRVLTEYEMTLPNKKEGLAAILQNVRLFLTRFPLIRETMKWWRLSIRDFSDKLKNPALKTTFRNFWHADMSMITLLMTMAFLNKKIAGYPIGGSSLFIDQVLNRFLRLGGTIRYGTPVEEILVEDGKAHGIRLSNGRVHYADYVISAADGYTTIFKMLKGKFISNRLRRLYKDLEPFPPLLLAGFGIDDAFDDVPPSVAGIEFPLNTPMIIGERSVDRLGFQVYNFDPTLAPEGETMLTAMVPTDYDYWENLSRDENRYKAAKENVLQQMIQGLEQRFPGIASKVKMRDLSTPVTFANYTGNFRGSYEGWLPTPEALRTRIEKKLPGLDNFYLAGHWVEPGGGLPPSALSGRNVIRAICHERGIGFWASEAQEIAEEVF